MNDDAKPLEEDIQTVDVLDETFVMSDLQTVPVSIADNISVASVLPKHTLPNKKKQIKESKTEGICKILTLLKNC